LLLVIIYFDKSSSSNEMLTLLVSIIRISTSFNGKLFANIITSWAQVVKIINCKNRITTNVLIVVLIC
ncbi:MAG: hypothetical protein QM503_12190, partial [Bacteroidota bacterium]